jgi:hypothetical protein
MFGFYSVRSRVRKGAAGCNLGHAFAVRATKRRAAPSSVRFAAAAAKQKAI